MHLPILYFHISLKTVVLDGIFGMNKLWMSILTLTSNLLYWYKMNELYNLETFTFASGLLQRTCVWSYTESVSPISCRPLCIALMQAAAAAGRLAAAAASRQSVRQGALHSVHCRDLTV